MNITRAKAIISFYEGLTKSERVFLGSIAFSERTNSATTAHTKQVKKRKTRKLKSPIEHYDDAQIKYAWELLQDGRDRFEISRKTGIKVGSVMKGYLQQRIANMQKKVVQEEKPISEERISF